MGFFQNLFGKPGDSAEAAPRRPSAPVRLFAPLAGEAVPLSEVSDPTFGEKLLGDGMAIRPGEGKVFAPCDGTVGVMFETGHAVSMTSADGAEILIHVGLDTVKLKGRHYTVRAKNGDRVKKGDLLMEFDAEAIRAEGYDLITPVVICNSDDYTAILPFTGKTVSPGELILELEK